MDFSELDYEMVFGNLEKQEKFTKVYHLKLWARMDILIEKKKSSPSESEDSCTSWDAAELYLLYIFVGIK